MQYLCLWFFCSTIYVVNNPVIENTGDLLHQSFDEHIKENLSGPRLFVICIMLFSVFFSYYSYTYEVAGDMEFSITNKLYYFWIANIFFNLWAFFYNTNIILFLAPYISFLIICGIQPKNRMVNNLTGLMIKLYINRLDNLVLFLLHTMIYITPFFVLYHDRRGLISKSYITKELFDENPSLVF